MEKISYNYAFVSLKGGANYLNYISSRTFLAINNPVIRPNLMGATSTFSVISQ